MIALLHIWNIAAAYLWYLFLSRHLRYTAGGYGRHSIRAGLVLQPEKPDSKPQARYVSHVQRPVQTGGETVQQGSPPHEGQAQCPVF